MTNDQIYSILFSGGRFSLPWLIHFSHPEAGDYYFINAYSKVEYDGNTYLPSSFEYTEPDTEGKGGQLNITLVDNNLISFIDKSDYRMTIEVVGTLREDDTIEPIKIYHHQFCNISWSADMQMSVSLNSDDRQDMTFPPYTFDSDNNRGGV